MTPLPVADHFVQRRFSRPRINTRNMVRCIKKPAPELRPGRLKLGSGWYVFVRWGDRPDEHLPGFLSENDAQQWIDEQSALWLKARSDSDCEP